MSLLGLVLNILRVPTGGLWMAAAWPVAAVLMALTTVGPPSAWAHLKPATPSLWPVGMAIAGAEEAAVPRSGTRVRRAAGEAGIR